VILKRKTGYLLATHFENKKEKTFVFVIKEL